MLEGVLEDMVTTFSLCVPAFIFSGLGVWASTKSWWFYFINILAFGWIGFVVGGAAWEASVGFPTIEQWMTRSIPLILVVVLHIGTIVTIKSMKRNKVEGRLAGDGRTNEESTRD